MTPAITARVAIAGCVLVLAASAAAGPKIRPADDAAPDALQAYVAGNGFLNRGLFDMAVAEYRKFLAVQPRHEKAAMARYGLAVGLFRLGRLDEADAELTQLRRAKDFEYAVEVAVMSGQCRLAAGKFAQAVEILRPVVEDHSEHALADDAAAQLIEATFRDGRYDEAADWAERFQKIWRDSAARDRVEYFAGLAKMRLGNVPAAAKHFETILGAYSKSPFAAHAALLLGQCRHQAGDHSAAEQTYRRVLENEGHPFRADGLLGLATLLRERGRPDEAAGHLEEILTDFKASEVASAAILLKGKINFDRGRYDAAAESFRALRESDGPLAAEAAYWQGKCKLRSGDFPGAAADLKQAVEDFPDGKLLAEMMYDRGIALLRAGEISSAAEALEEFRQRFPEHAATPDAIYALATIEHQRGRYARSQEHVQALLAGYPNHALAPQAAFLAAENDYLDGQYPKAAAAYREFLKLWGADPRAGTAEYRLGMTLYRLQEFDEALPLLRKVDSDEEGAEGFDARHLALGDIFFQRGEWKPAETHLRLYLAGLGEGGPRDDAVLKLGLVLQRQGHYAEAVEQFDLLLETEPPSAHRVQAEFERAQALAALGRGDEAGAGFEQVLERKDARFDIAARRHLAALAARRGDFKGAAHWYGQVAQQAELEDQKAEALLEQGKALINAREFSRAEKALKQFARRFSEHDRLSEARGHLAAALSRQDRHEAALEVIDKIDTSRLAPRSQASVLYERAWCLRAIGREDDAVNAFLSLIERHGESDFSAYARLELAAIRSQRGGHEEAIELLRALRRRLDGERERFPETLHEQAAYQLGISLFRGGRFAEAAEALREFVERFPESGSLRSARYFAGEALFEQKKYADAAGFFEAVAAQDAADAMAPPALLRLGECRAALADWEQSRGAFAAFLERYGEDKQRHQAEFGVGWAHENQGSLDKAVESYQRVVARHKGPTAARAQFQIGQCLFAQKKYDEAVRELLKVDILYGYPEWSAAALFEAGRCFEQLRKFAEAEQQFSAVTEKHAGTEWAKKAADRLRAMSKSARHDRVSSAAP